IVDCWNTLTCTQLWQVQRRVGPINNSSNGHFVQKSSSTNQKFIRRAIMLLLLAVSTMIRQDVKASRLSDHRFKSSILPTLKVSSTQSSDFEMISIDSFPRGISIILRTMVPSSAIRP
ncbi:hypothetical protein M513_06465, partial [Trichuris suis]